MQFQRFRRATVESRCSGSVTKMHTGLFKFNLFNGVSIPRGFAILDTNLHDLQSSLERLVQEEKKIATDG